MRHTISRASKINTVKTSLTRACWTVYLSTLLHTPPPSLSSSLSPYRPLLYFSTRRVGTKKFRGIDCSIKKNLMKNWRISSVVWNWRDTQELYWKLMEFFWKFVVFDPEHFLFFCTLSEHLYERWVPSGMGRSRHVHTVVSVYSYLHVRRTLWCTTLTRRCEIQFASFELRYTAESHPDGDHLFIYKTAVCAAGMEHVPTGNASFRAVCIDLIIQIINRIINSWYRICFIKV